MTGSERARLLALDRCLQVLENALLEGKERVNAPLADSLRSLLGQAGLIPDHRLEGRRTERVLDDIFALQAKLMGVDDERHVG